MRALQVTRRPGRKHILTLLIVRHDDLNITLNEEHLSCFERRYFSVYKASGSSPNILLKLISTSVRMGKHIGHRATANMVPNENRPQEE